MLSSAAGVHVGNNCKCILNNRNSDINDLVKFTRHISNKYK